MKKTFLIFMSAALLTGCTANDSAHNYGGTEEVTLPAGVHFVDAYWDAGDHLWYTTRPMIADDKPTVYTMREKSALGQMQGVVVFKESR